MSEFEYGDGPRCAVLRRSQELRKNIAVDQSRRRKIKNTRYRDSQQQAAPHLTKEHSRLSSSHQAGFSQVRKIGRPALRRRRRAAEKCS